MVSVHPRWLRIGVTLALVSIAASLTPRAADAHPLHTTITEIVAGPIPGTVRATVRVFLDDFTTAVQGASHSRLTSASGAPWDTASLAYALSAFGMIAHDGRPIALHSCGTKRTDNLLWVCLEGNAASLATIKVKNAFLCDLYADQINVVQASIGSARHSVMFTRGDGAKPL